MGRPKGWASDVTGRPAMRSPGRPTAGRREHRRRFWAAVAVGLSSEDAAAEAGVSVAVGVRWFREGGGMPSVTLAPLSGRYLSFAEREEIALLRAGGRGVREIARQLGRSPSTAPGSSVAMPRHAAAVLTTEQALRSGTLTGGRDVRSQASWL
jgi:Helix-turn-helix domain